MLQVTMETSTFCGLVFSQTLRRLSLQRNRVVKYDVDAVNCLPNLNSISMGLNILFIPMCGTIVPCSPAPLATSFTSVTYVKLSYLGSQDPNVYTLCTDDDVSIDEYFIDERQYAVYRDANSVNDSNSVLGNRTSVMPRQLLDNSESSSNVNSISPRTRVIVADHVTMNFGELLLSKVHQFDPGNMIEVIDLSWSNLAARGLRFVNFFVGGLKKLRVAILNNMNLRICANFTLGDAVDLDYLDLSNNPLEDMTAEDFSNAISGTTYAKSVNLSSCNIQELPFDFLKQTPTLKYLDLSGNSFSNLSIDISLTTAPSIGLNVSNNNLISLSDHFIQILNRQTRPVTLNIDDNPLRCDCDTLHFVRWFLSTTVTIENKHSVVCNYRGITMRNMTDVNVLADLESECAPLSFRITIATTTSVGGVCILALIIGAVAIRYRWHIRYKWHRMKKRCRKEEIQSKKRSLKRFACLINYTAVDWQWIDRELVVNVERCCGANSTLICQRDAQPGYDVFDFLEDAIDQCRRLVYVVGTEKRVEDDMFLFEWSLIIACDKRLYSMADVIVVFKDDVPFDSLDKSRLKYLSKPGCKSGARVLRFHGNDMFWRELQDALDTKLTLSDSGSKSSKELAA